MKKLLSCFTFCFATIGLITGSVFGQQARCYCPPRPVCQATYVQPQVSPVVYPTLSSNVIQVIASAPVVMPTVVSPVVSVPTANLNPVVTMNALPYVASPVASPVVSTAIPTDSSQTFVIGSNQVEGSVIAPGSVNTIPAENVDSKSAATVEPATTPPVVANPIANPVPTPADVEPVATGDAEITAETPAEETSVLNQGK